MLQHQADAAAYVAALLDALRAREASLGRSASVAVPDEITHVDRLFRFWVETRRECTVCGWKVAVADACWDWSLAADDVVGPDEAAGQARQA